MRKEAAGLDLATAPPACVEEWLAVLPPYAEEAIEVLRRNAGHHEPPGPPHHQGHQHVEDGGRRPIIRSVHPTNAPPGAVIALLVENLGPQPWKVFIRGVEATIVS